MMNGGRAELCRVQRERAVKDTRSDHFGIRRVYLLTRAHSEMFLLKHTLGITSDHRPPCGLDGTSSPRVGSGQGTQQGRESPKC